MIKIIVPILMLSLAGVAHAAGDAEAGKLKALACAGCHGPDGNSPAESFPKIAGQGEKYIVKQLSDFKANTTREDPIMIGMVAALSEQDMQDIGAFFQLQKLAGPAPFEDTKVAKGREIYKGGNMQTGVPACQGCHGPTGAGNPGAGYPQMGGQYVAYTMKQLNAFKNGDRTNDDREIMRNVVKGMTDDEIDAVAHYIASLKY